MKTSPIIIGIFCFLCLVNSFAQTQLPEDKIIGLWWSEKKDGKIEIFKSGGKYFGKLVWSSDMYNPDGVTSHRDVYNPDPKLKNRPIQNMIFMTEFEYKDKIWDNGKIYDARTGSSYCCYMKIVDDKIFIKAYIGFSIFGQSETWERVK